MINLTLGSRARDQPSRLFKPATGTNPFPPGSDIAHRSPQGQGTGPAYNPPGTEEKLQTNLVEILMPAIEPGEEEPAASPIRGTLGNLDIPVHDDVILRIATGGSTRRV